MDELFPGTRVGKALDPVIGEPAARARRGDPATSVDAARSVKLTKNRAATLSAIQHYDRTRGDQYIFTREGFDHDYRRLGAAWPHQSDSGLRTRLRELIDAGYVEVVDHRGSTGAGRPCQRLRLTHEGRSSTPVD